MEKPPYLQRHDQIAQEIHEASLGLPMYLHYEIRNLKLPRTAYLMFSILHQTDHLYYSIEDAARNRDMIGCKTLTRVLIEQYVRFMYLFVRLMREPTDELAIEYRDSLYITEHFACKRAKAIARREFGEGLSRTHLWAEIQAEKLYFEKYSISDVERLLDTFSWEAITLYLEREKLTEDQIGLSDAIYEHAYLVCSQHGGLTLYKAIAFEDADKEADEFEQLCLQGLRLATDVKGFIAYFFGQFDENFYVYYERISLAAEGIGHSEKLAD
jgi:hypothetical protein